jgi:hypothetical protein
MCSGVVELCALPLVLHAEYCRLELMLDRSMPALWTLHTNHPNLGLSGEKL